MEPDQRHFYELISQETPCRIYFDLEFERRINPQISTPHQEEEMMSIFKEFLVSDIKTRFDILHDEANSLLENIVDLDSSTTQKFSRHLVIHIPGAIFENNGAVGHYVRNMCARIEAKILTNGESRQQLSKLFVHAHTPEAHNDDHGQAASKSIFVDLSVYSRNRQFRLYLSSKIGKEAVFLPANTTLLSTNKRKHKNEDHHQKSAQFIPDKELFYKSLVSDSILKPGVRVLADVVSKEEQTRLGSMGVGFGKIIKATSNSNNAVSSPFEEIDNFMLDHIKAVSGYESSSMFFRSASFFPDCKKLAIGILDDEYYNNSLNIS